MVKTHVRNTGTRVKRTERFHENLTYVNTLIIDSKLNAYHSLNTKTQTYRELFFINLKNS